MQDGADFLAQGHKRRSPDIALEVQQVAAGFRFRLFLLGLAFGLALLVQHLEGFFGEPRGLDIVRGRLELAVDVRHLDLAGVLGLAA